MIEFVGTTFPATATWYPHESATIASIHKQIDVKFPNSRNLFINTTWFGPQYNNSGYNNFLNTVKHQQFDNMFLLSAVDPIALTPKLITEMSQKAGADHVYCLGNFDGAHEFNLPSVVVGKMFQHYHEEEITPVEFAHVFLNYNRKPHAHRVKLIQHLREQGLDDYGVITLGSDAGTAELTVDDGNITGTQDSMGFDTGSMRFGIADDIHSLGRLDIWNSHFLNIVSETEFLPWDNRFVTEKTWKPIIGLRPFVINGQTKIYKWLREQGFRTFNQYWSNINVEDESELTVHANIVAVVNKLRGLGPQRLLQMYHSMREDLQWNRQRFVEFSREQQHRIDNLL
jgi:hypothetical protein